MAVFTLGGSGFRQVFTNASSPIAQEVQVNLVADTASNTNSQFFLISSTSVDYYVWNNVAAAGVDPAIPGKTGIAVAYAANASAITIAIAMATAIAAVGGAGTIFTSGKSSGSIYIKNTTSGVPKAAPGLGNSLWTFGPIEPGTVNINAAGSGLVYLFTTPPTPDYTYEIVISTALPAATTSPLLATIAAPLKVGPNTPIYLPLVWTTNISTTGEINWSYSGYKLT